MSAREERRAPEDDDEARDIDEHIDRLGVMPPHRDEQESCAERAKDTTRHKISPLGEI